MEQTSLMAYTELRQSKALGDCFKIIIVDLKK